MASSAARVACAALVQERLGSRFDGGRAASLGG